jgi:predicted Zn-dependent peptidase
MKNIILIVALLWSPLFSFAKGPDIVETPLAGDALKTTVHRLSNGLTVYLSPNTQTPRVAANIAVRAGSKNDPADSTGMAHYLEHMLFKGTRALGTLDDDKEAPHLARILALYEKRFSAVDPAERERIYKEIDAENIAASQYAVPNELSKVYAQLGIQGVNAYTSDEQTVYVGNFPSNRAEAWATVEVERFARPVFRLFLGELETVYEEKNRSLDNAGRILGEAINKRLYGDHPYGRTTLGSIEHLKNPSLKKMYEFYGRWYVPENMAITLAGDFDRAQMLALLEKHFGAWKPTPLLPDDKRTLPTLSGEASVEVMYEAEEMVELVWPTVPARHPDADALQVLGMMLSNGRTGIIDIQINLAQKVKRAGGGAGFYNEAGEFEVYAVPKLGQTLEQARALLLEAVAAAKSGGFAEDDLKAAITNFEVGEKYQLESNESRVARMTGSFVRGEPWSVTVESLDRLRRVTKADVMRVAVKYLGDNRISAYRRKGKPELPSIVKPVFTKLKIDATLQSAFAAKVLSIPAAPLMPRWLEENRDYTLVPLASGKLYAAPNPFNDLFSLTFSFERGRRQERELCSALGLLNLAGAGEMSAEEYKRQLYRLGSSVSYGCGENSSYVAISGLDANLEATLKLMQARFAAPTLSTDTLKKSVDVAIGAHQDTKKDPGSILSALGQVARRGKDGSVLNELTDAELRALDLPRIQALIRGAFDFKRKTAYIGNRASADIAKLAGGQGAFKEPPVRAPLRLLRPSSPKVYFTHRDMVQAQAGVFAADEVLDPEHVVDYSFYASYLGGGMGAVIFQEIREARSLAYSAGGGYDRGNYKGDDNEVFGSVGSQADKAVEAVTLLSDLLRHPPIAAKRFSETKRTIEEGYRNNPTQFRAIPGTVQSWEEQGILGGDPRPRRFAQVLGYGQKDLETFAGRFKSRPMSYFVLGHRDRVNLDGLKKLGDFEEKTLEQIFPY